MRPIIKLVLAGVLLGAVSLAADDEVKPGWATSVLNVESGVLWEVGDNTPFAYKLVPIQLSWRSKQFIGREFSNGSRIVVRHRLTLFATLVNSGPESHYVGISASPSLEWWDKTGKWSLFAGAGGGVGLIDSRDTEGGQGQDFTFNWFIRGGIERVIRKNARLTAGIMFQHLSNAGATEPNPSINTLGFMIGYGWTF